MKKILSLILVLAMAMSLVACKASSDEKAKVWDAAEIENVLTAVKESVTYDDADFENLIKNGTECGEVTAEMAEYHLGKTDYKYERAVVCEPLMSAQAFSIGMIVTETADEAATLATDLKASLNPNKWICVGVEEDDVKTVAIGNGVFYVMSSMSDEFVAAFEAVSAEEEG